MLKQQDAKAEFKPFEKKDAKSEDDKKDEGSPEKDSCPDCKSENKHGGNDGPDGKTTCKDCGKTHPTENWKKTKETKASEETTSQTAKIDVIKTSEPKIMKITQLSDITDESLKQMSASVITDFIKDVDKNWKAEKEKADSAVALAQVQMTELAAAHEAVKAELAKVQAVLAQLNAEKAEKEALAAFNTRMATLDEKFNLSDEARKAILSDIKASDTDEKFNAWLTKMDVFFKPFAKAAAAEAKKDEAKASADVVVDDALNNGKKEVAIVANASDVNKSKNKWADVLKAGSFSVK